MQSWSIACSHPLHAGRTFVCKVKRSLTRSSHSIQFRGVKDYSDPNFVLPRVLDKVFVAFFLTTLYWGLGSHKSSTNVSNITALLFMWATLPGFTVVSYIPAIVMDKPLFRRQAVLGLMHMHAR